MCSQQLVKHGWVQRHTLESPTIRHFIESLPLLYEKGGPGLVPRQKRTWLPQSTTPGLNDHDGMYDDFVIIYLSTRKLRKLSTSLSWYKTTSSFS